MRSKRSLSAVLLAALSLVPASGSGAQALKDLKVGDVVRPEESIAIGPRSIRFSGGDWQLVSKTQGLNRARGGSAAEAEVTAGLFASIEGTTALAFAYFRASETRLPGTRWVSGTADCAGSKAEARYQEDFGSPPAQPECHQIRLLKGFLGSSVTGHWAEARQRLQELGVRWSARQFYSRYTNYPHGDSFEFSIWIDSRLFAARGRADAPDGDADVPQAFVDWSRRQVEGLRQLSRLDTRSFALERLPRPAEKALIEMPRVPVRQMSAAARAMIDHSL